MALVRDCRPGVAPSRIMQQVFVRERLQKLDQVVLLTLTETKRVKDARLVRMIDLASSRVVVQHLFERGNATVMHVGSRDRNIPERRCAESPNIFGAVRVFVQTAIWRNIKRY